MAEEADPRNNDGVNCTGRVLSGARAGSLAQTRFDHIPEAHLNMETVAGVRDMTLGRVRNGAPVGAPTIRFDTGMNSNTNPHINIDPLGVPAAANPHIDVSPRLVRGAQVTSEAIKIAGPLLTIAAVAVDTWRVYKAFENDDYIQKNAPRIIEELENAIQQLRDMLRNEGNSERKQEIRNTIEHYENVLKDVHRSRDLGVNVNTLKTMTSVGGGWGGGYAGGTAGAWAGAQSGAAVGALFGPVGAVVGAPVGAVVGAISGGVGGGMLGSYVGVAVADTGLAIADGIRRILPF